MRRAAYLLAAVVLTLAVVELVAYAALRVSRVAPATSYAQTYRRSSCLKADDFNYGGVLGGSGDADVALARIPHPYFGFVLNPAGGDRQWRRQTVGPDFEQSLRYRIDLGDDPRPPDVYTVGIFGASVAVSFAEYVMRDSWFADELSRRVPELAGSDIVVRNLAIGGSRQPAQFAIATHYRELFDLTINLDGYSEQAIDQYPRWPVDYPMFADFYFARDAAPAYLRALAFEYACSAISRVGMSAPLRFSSAYYLGWYLASAAMKRALASAGRRVGPVDELALDDEQRRRLFAAYYRRFTRYQDQLLSTNGVRAYFFLQPNQYVSGSKPFSVEERETALGDGRAAETAARYVHLRRTVAELAGDGTRAFDLTGVFEAVGETVYVDACCHLNDRGNRLVAEAMLERIAADFAADRSRQQPPTAAP